MKCEIVNSLTLLHIGLIPGVIPLLIKLFLDVVPSSSSDVNYSTFILRSRLKKFCFKEPARSVIFLKSSYFPSSTSVPRKNRG